MTYDANGGCDDVKQWPVAYPCGRRQRGLQTRGIFFYKFNVFRIRKNLYLENDRGSTIDRQEETDRVAILANPKPISDLDLRL